MTDVKLSPTAESYVQIWTSFIQGLIRIWSAEATAARLSLALTQFHGSGRPGLQGPASEVLTHLNRIPHSNYDSFSYVTNVSHLVYATSLLDTFLSDTTMFLFLMFPGAMGKGHQISLRSLIDSSSRHDAITTAAASRTRQVGYASFADRLKLLRESFGLDVSLDSDTLERFEHYSSVRNSAVHDQGIFDLRLDEDGHVRSQQKTCALHPSQVTGEDVSKAIKAYEKVALSVAKGVVEHALKDHNHPAVLHILTADTLPVAAAKSVASSENDA